MMQHIALALGTFKCVKIKVTKPTSVLACSQLVTMMKQACSTFQREQTIYYFQTEHKQFQYTHQ